VGRLDFDYTERTVLAAPLGAAGAAVTVPCPESQDQILIAVRFRLATSAVVATRSPVVSVLDGSGISLIDCVSGFGLTAGSTADFSFVNGLGEWDAAGGVFASGPLAELPLDAGDTIQISVQAMDAGDQLSRVRLTLLQVPIRPAVR
jgi:hypothetical protein